MEKLIKIETLVDFYKRTNQDIPPDLLREHSVHGHFNVKQTTTLARQTPYNRRDYFKICLSTGDGNGVLRYQDQQIPLHPPCLIFTNPSVPASIEIASSINRYYCLFNSRFIEGHIPQSVQYLSALFNPLLKPVIKLTTAQKDKLSVYFEQLQSLLETDYVYKWDMIRSLVLLIIHEGIRLQRAEDRQPPILRDRVVNGFFSLLNQQFPIDSPESPLKLLSPSAFAEHLHVHVNHLNSIVKRHTGKSTRELIHERVILEAKTLLRNTDWNISEIAYALGFAYPSHFNKYFKQTTSTTPREFRAAASAWLQ